MTRTDAHAAKTGTLSLIKPLGHAVLGFANEDSAQAAAQMLRDAGLGDEDVTFVGAQDMARALSEQIDGAGPLSSYGQEMNLARHRLDLAQQGVAWLVVHLPDASFDEHVVEAAKKHQASLAQKYNRFMIEELI